MNEKVSPYTVEPGSNYIICLVEFLLWLLSRAVDGCGGSGWLPSCPTLFPLSQELVNYSATCWVTVSVQRPVYAHLDI